MCRASVRSVFRFRVKVLVKGKGWLELEFGVGLSLERWLGLRLVYGKGYS
jgi:hypothetical protein